MFKRIFFSTAAVLLLISVQARAAAPNLPANAIAPDTTIVVHMDGSVFTPDAIRQAAGSVLGANNPNRAQLDQQIANFQQKYDDAVKAGAQSITIVGKISTAPDAAPGAKPAAANSDSNQGTVYVGLKPGADSAKLEKMIRENMKPAEQNKAAFSHEGNFLVVREKGKMQPSQSDAGRTRQFTDAISHANNAAVVVAFIPDKAIRDHANAQKDDPNTPKALQDAIPVLANSQWATVAVTFGQTPAIVITDNAADADSAAKLTTSINAGLAQLKQAAQNGGGEGIMAMIAPRVAPLADALKPTQTGSTVTVTLNGQGLSLIGNTIAQLAPMLGNMGGRGQDGPGAPAATPRSGRRGTPPPPPGNDQ